MSGPENRHAVGKDMLRKAIERAKEFIERLFEIMERA